MADVCAYCGAADPQTIDHVPPKLMLEEPYPDNLVTVPACQECNKKFMRDDEYTRTFIALDFRAAGNSAAQSRLPKIFRSLARPQAKGFSDSLKRQLKPTDLVDGFGQPLGLRAEVDVSRINATGERFARGFYYYLTRTPVPHEWQVWVYSKPGYNSIDFIVPSFNAIMDKCGDHTQGHIGSDLLMSLDHLRRSCRGGRNIVPSAECERERFHAGIEKLDLELAIGDRSRLSNELIQALLGDRAATVIVYVTSMARARRLSID